VIAVCGLALLAGLTHALGRVDLPGSENQVTYRGSLVPVTRSGLAAWRYETNRLPRNARGLRDRQAFEHVRMQAGALFAAGHAQAQVARTLGVARQVVSRWHAHWQAAGLAGLGSAGPTGPARACPTPSLPPSTGRSSRAPARTASTPTTGPLPASPR
jgi:hypothetical protein